MIVYIHIYIYVHSERERESQQEASSLRRKKSYEIPFGIINISDQPLPKQVQTPPSQVIALGYIFSPVGETLLKSVDVRERLRRSWAS